MHNHVEHCIVTVSVAREEVMLLPRRWMIDFYLNKKLMDDFCFG